MKNISKTYCLLIIIFTLINLIIFNGYAQKLPKTQQISLPIPPNAKANGDAAEWNNQFQAYNKETSIYYTMANDNEKLYLALQMSDPRMIEKMLYSGITLIVNSEGIKKDKAKGNVTVTYPIVDFKYVRGILINAGDKTYWGGLPSRNRRGGESLTRTDSSVAKANKVFFENSKNIKIFGVKEIKDTLLSIYNEQNIKAVAKFDNKGLYTYELMIPLSYLGLNIKQSSKFTYNIRLNDWNNAFFNDYPDPVTREARDTDPDMSGINDFWSEYTLVK